MDSSLTSPSAPTHDSNTAIPAPRRRRRGLAGAGLLAVALLLTGCTLPTFGQYKGSTTQARTEFHLWQGFFIAGLIVGGLVLLLIIWAIVRYRRKSDEMPVQTQYHTLTEIIYTAVPIIIVVVLFVFTVLAENKVDATPPNPQATVVVHAFQWGWEFEYSGGAGSGCANPASPKAIDKDCVKVIGQTTQAPTMVMPAGSDVEIHLNSLDVLHGFYVPQFNFSRYASPGYTTEFDFNVLHPGVYRGQCTQLCGLYHSLMFFNVKAVTPTQFTSWLHQQQAELRAHPSGAPKLPAGVSNSGGTSSNGSNEGADLYGD